MDKVDMDALKEWITTKLKKNDIQFNPVHYKVLHIVQLYKY